MWDLTVLYPSVHFRYALCVSDGKERYTEVFCLYLSPSQDMTSKAPPHQIWAYLDCGSWNCKFQERDCCQ